MSEIPLFILIFKEKIQTEIGNFEKNTNKFFLLKPQFALFLILKDNFYKHSNKSPMLSISNNDLIYFVLVVSKSILNFLLLILRNKNSILYIILN